MPAERLELKYQIHKDSLPEDTIKRVRDILSGLGLFLLETEWWCGAEGVYSVRTEDVILKVGTNGKGVSRKYALAGSHAEFLERLQAGELVNHSVGLMSGPSIEDPDMVLIELGQLVQQCRPVMKILLHESIKKACDLIGKKKLVRCLPYYNVFDRNVEHLPILVNWATGSNGLCAGNTPEEAICQGICEVFERFVAREIYSDKFRFPTIPVSALRESTHYEILKKLVDKKYNVIIKDCTLGGTFPVLAMIIVNEGWDRYLYAFGSDPLFEVALQRCITEIFQGYGDSEFGEFLNTQGLNLDFSSRQFGNKSFSSIEDQKLQELWSIFRFRSGELPNRVFFSDSKPKFQDAFQGAFKSNRDSLGFLLKIIKTNGYKLYIRDHSFLGFPAYRIYIPGMSELQRLRREAAVILITQEPFIRKCLLNLKGCSSGDIHKCARLLEPLFDIPGSCHELARSDFFVTMAKIKIDASSDPCQFSHLAYLLAFMFYRVKDYKKACKYLSLYLKEAGDTVDNRGYYRGVLLYLKFKSGGASDKAIKDNLDILVGEEQSKGIISDLRNPEDVFKYFTLPICGDCSRCPIADQCYYEEWKAVALRINEKMAQNPIKQDRLSALFVS